jgi:hypothetical protein
MEDLMSRFQSADKDAAHLAVKELFIRGESAIPFLAALKGNKKTFTAAGWLGNPSGSQLIFAEPVAGDSDVLVPVEVAALFLITAIYEDDLKFAQSPYLTDLGLAPIRRQAKNSQTLIDRAWRSVDPWVAQLKSMDLDQMRKQKRSPLDGSLVDFW